MIGDASDDVGEPSLGIEVIEASGLDERVHDGGSAAAFVGAGEEIVLAPEGERADGAFGGVVGHFEPAVVDEAGESGPARGRVADGAGERALAADLGQRCIEEGFEFGQNRRCRASRRLAGLRPRMSASTANSRAILSSASRAADEPVSTKTS